MLNDKLKKLHEVLLENASSDILTEYEKIKGEIEGIGQEEVQGAIIRSKVKWAEAGDKNTQHFLNLEKRNAINKTIIRLENIRGQSLVNDHDILNECKDFYKNLYTEVDTITNTEQIEIKFFIEDHTRLAYDDKEDCEGILTMEECTKAIKDMPNGNSPGNDGFTVDWYKYF